TRKGLLDAMRARHAYAATDNILLDVHCGDHIQGDIFQTSQKPRVEVRIDGTAPVAKVEVIKNNKFVFSSKPNKSSVQFVYEDRDAQAGESYYYVRIQQADTQMAWSSPMWITYKP
ncbi:MAG TPA: hypothetical protein VKV15_19230, partial [Bryobacteraceae bacterium]|nr:hypothetical protein [Bryobacteraceae bacterium]